jgi:hypothetical protein
MIVWGGDSPRRTATGGQFCLLECVPIEWYHDSDGDTYGDPLDTLSACEQPPEYVADNTDCDDSNADTYPGASEVNDGQDNQCPGDQGHGIIDETSGDSGFHDPADKDSYCWPAQPGATEYEVARSLAPTMSSPCAGTTTTATCWNDPELPAPGQAFHYMNRPIAPNIGSWGKDSDGAERVAICP